jgi:hypothetical protein
MRRDPVGTHARGGWISGRPRCRRHTMRASVAVRGSCRHARRGYRSHARFQCLARRRRPSQPGKTCSWMLPAIVLAIRAQAAAPADVVDGRHPGLVLANRRGGRRSNSRFWGTISRFSARWRNAIHGSS